MKKIPAILLAFTLCLTAMGGQPPVISMTTSKPIGSSISFSLSANATTTIQIDFGDGALVNKTIDLSIDTITGTLVGSQTVKIYGTDITLLYCANNQLTALDVSKNITLKELVCSYNQLTTIDISKNTALVILYCDNNQLTTLDVSNNKALVSLGCNNLNITDLDVSNNTALLSLYCFNNHLTTLNVSNNTALIWLYCMYNQLTNLDISKNTALTMLAVYNNLLSTLDLSKNTLLATLYCDNNQLTALDVRKNTTLQNLSCCSNKITVLDVSKNTLLTTLYCIDNQLTALNVSMNTTLQNLYCGFNQLSNLDVSKNKALTSLYCYYNNLTFATLPLKQPSWVTYYYSPQNSIPIVNILGTGVELDLSSQLAVNGSTTVYSWKTTGGATLVNGTDYTINNGKFIFLKGQANKILCAMTNASFPDFTDTYPLTTTSTTIISLTNFLSLTTSNAIGATCSFYLKASAPTTAILVDFGDGTQVSKTIGNTPTPIIGTLVGSQKIKIYGTGITYLDCSDNRIISLNISKYPTLAELYCNDNQLSTLDLTKNIALTNLSCYNNQIDTLNIFRNTALANIICSNNRLAALDVRNNNALIYLSCINNQLAFNSLPLKQTKWTTYNYAPQGPIPIARNLLPGVELDLDQAPINGNETSFTWKTQSGKTLALGTDYTVTGSITTFLKGQIDSVYCEMDNNAFPLFADFNGLRTTYTKIASGANINAQKLAEVEIYTHDQSLCINLPYNAQCSVFDVNGRLVISTALSSGTNNLQLQHSGVYLVKITGSKGIVTHKVLVE